MRPNCDKIGRLAHPCHALVRGALLQLPVAELHETPKVPHMVLKQSSAIHLQNRTVGDSHLKLLVWTTAIDVDPSRRCRCILWINTVRQLIVPVKL